MFVESTTAEQAAEKKKPIVVLVGPPGAGKTTIGRRLARALNTTFIDSDDLIEETIGKPCGVVFSELGEEKFRDLEEEQIVRALHSDGVVSLGGGAVLREANRLVLNDHNVVWIDVSAEEGINRTSTDNTRPVLAASDPLAHYNELLAQRSPLYRAVSGYRVRTDQRSPQKAVADVLGFIESAIISNTPSARDMK
ncbi:shikimate kinase [Corynebacterium kutscheri]|nr:shikimate kinase [Corynebacterium kutscheri]